jgi:hypothetical protein
MRSLFALRELGLVVLCFLLALSAAHAQGGLPPILSPKTLVSPSGEYTLWVNPSEKYGVGEATYRLRHGNRVVWEGIRPYTLYEAAVTNDGTVGGYAYSYGLKGDNGKHPEDGGDFEVVILAPTGQTRLLQKTRRAVHSGPEFHYALPNVEGLIVDAANDRMIVRVMEERKEEETWWRYQLSTGRVQSRRAPPHPPERDGASYILTAARAATGTPLILMQWIRYGNERPMKTGARFALIDLQGKPVWQLDLPHDYDISGGNEARNQLMDEIRAHGALLHTDQAGQFTLRFVAQKRRVTFAAAPEKAGKWRVTEIHKEPYTANGRQDSGASEPQ